MLFKKIKKLPVAEEIQNRYKIVLDNQGIAIIEPGSFREKKRYAKELWLVI